MTEPTTPSSAVEKRTRLTNDELRALNTDNALAFFASRGETVTDLSEELGSGFTVMKTDDKAQLVGVGFLIAEWHFAEGDNGEFVSLTVITEKNEKLIVNDGSTGIRDQVHDLESRGFFAPILVRNGLRVSEYFYDPNTGEKFKNKADGLKKATTFYLAV